jgi:molybdopterin synthase sulfur carrier subunit
LTIKVAVRFFTTLREITGKKEELLELPKPLSVDALLKQLSKKYGKEFDDYMFDEIGDVRGHLQVLINGRSVSTMQGLKTQLKDTDQVAILPPVGGG